MIKTRLLIVDSESTWRGGQSQSLLLFKSLREAEDRGEGLEVYLSAPTQGVLAERIKKEGGFLAERLLLQPPWLPKFLGFMWHAHILSPALINAQSGKAHGWLYLLSFLPKFKKTVLLVHRRIDDVPKQNRWTRCKYFSARIHGFICVSNYIAKVLIHYGVKPQKTITVYDAVETVQGCPSAEERQEAQRRLVDFPLQDSKVIIGSAAALIPDKGLDRLIDACARLKTEGLAFRCLIAGEGRDEKILKDKVAALSLDDTVFFLGFLDKMDDFYRSIDIYTLCSRNEGLGSSLLEAASFGCALVGSTAGGIPEVLVDPLNQVRHTPDHLTVEDLTRTLRNLITNPALLLAEKNKSMVMVSERFSVAPQLKEHLRVYRDAL